jgi:hypothetical protein
MTTQPASVSVTLPVGLAIDRVKCLLFQPFDLGKWFVIGFCAWLAHLGEQGFHANFSRGWSEGRGSPRHEFEHARDFVMSNLHWIVPLVAGLVIVGLALGLVFLWLNCRGKFMFLHCVALDKAEVAVPWRKFAREGNSLFWFRCVLGLIGFVLVLPLLALAGIAVFSLVVHHGPRVAAVLGLVAIVLMLVAVGVVFGLIGKLTPDFVPELPRGLGGIAEPAFGQRRSLYSVCVIPDRARAGDHGAGVGPGARDLLLCLLPDGHSVSGHGHSAADPGVPTGLLALLLRAVRRGV